MKIQGVEFKIVFPLLRIDHYEIISQIPLHVGCTGFLQKFYLSTGLWKLSIKSISLFSGSEHNYRRIILYILI